MAWPECLAPDDNCSGVPASAPAPATMRRLQANLLDLPAARQCWDVLAATAAEPNPFLESWYLVPALAALDPAGAVDVLVLEAGDAWVGLMPLARPGRYYGRPLAHFANWHHANAFVGAPLVARGAEALFWTALFDLLDREAGRGLFLHLADLPMDGTLAAALKQVCATQGRPLGLVHCEERAMLSSPLLPEAYLDAALSGKKRKELRRQHARLAELGELEFVRRRDDADVVEWTAAFLALEAAGWKGKSGSALAGSRATASLFSEAIAGAAARGRLERLTLSLDGAPIAMLATFLAPPGGFSYKTAFDERFARYSPGVLLQRENLALLADPALDWCDSCAAADHPMIDHVWRERRAIGRFSVGIGGWARRQAFSLLLRAEMARSTFGPKRAGGRP